MKTHRKHIIKVLLAGMIMATDAYAVDKTESGTPRTTTEKIKLIIQAKRGEIAAEAMGKDYLYIGNKVATRMASSEMKQAKNSFKKHYDFLQKSINDPQQKNLLIFVQMSYDSLLESLKQPYSLDNAQVVLDYTTMVSEGLHHIADGYMKGEKKSFFIRNAGISPLLESIAKYYMAYQAGIKDENTVAIMQDTVKQVDAMIVARTKYPKNTVAMNQIMTKVNNLWGVVKKFYLNIDEGGLPFIVYKTAHDIRLKIKEYNQILTGNGTKEKAGK